MIKYFSLDSRIARSEKRTARLIKRKIKREGLPSLYKNKDFAKMAEVYRDSNGKRYYQYIDDFNIPVVRFAKLQSFILELGNCLSRNEIDLIITAMEDALAGTNGKPDLAMIGFLITEMKERKKYLVYEDILFKMVASLYIHEDQVPNTWDEEFEIKKVDQFKVDSVNNYDFFVGAGLSKYINYLGSLKKDYNQLSEMMKTKKKALQEMIKQYGLDRKSSTTSKTKVTN